MQDGTRLLINRGMKLKCGNCGKGSLFRAYLKLHETCPRCGLDLAAADTADGPAFFVGFFTMIVVTPIILFFTLSVDSWTAKAIAVLVGILSCAIVCLILLPPVKAILLNLQIKYDSGEGTIE